MKSREEKLVALNKLLHVLLKFSKHFNAVSLENKEDSIIIKWFSPKSTKYGKYHAFDEKELPVRDIDAALERYREKLRYELKKRNDGKSK